MKWFAFILTVLVVTQQSQAVDPVTATTVVKTAIDSGGKLVDLMKKLQDMFIKPITDQVDAEIKRVNVDIDGITKEEKQMVDNAKINLYNSRFDITRTRSVLSVLATETNYRSNTLIRILRLILRRTTPTATLMIGINVVVKKMQTLLERSKKLLHDAREQYEEVQKKMNIVRVKLETFATRVNHIGDVHGQRYTDYAKKLRTIVYASAASCMLFPPSCPAVYAACAAALESKLTKYRNDVAELDAKAKKSGAEAIKIVTKTKDDLDYMAAEDKLIGQWKSKVALVYEDFMGGDYLKNAKMMKLIGFKDYAINRLEELKTACTNYLKHVAATDD